MTNLLKASLIVEKIVKETHRDYKDYLRLLSLVNQGVNPFSPKEILLATNSEEWSQLLKKLKK
jgi:hypothetical protein